MDKRAVVLDILTRAADAGYPCPTNGDLAARIGSQSPSGPVKYMAALERAGVIEVARGNKSRVVKIVRTGKQTAGHVGALHWRLRDTTKAKAAAEKSMRTIHRKRGYSEAVTALMEPVPAPIDRDPCFKCGVRADVGCKHHPTTTGQGAA